MKSTQDIDFVIINLQDWQIAHSDISAIFLEFKLTKKVRNELMILLDEVISNILNHGASPTTSLLINLKILFNSTSVQLQISDNATLFNPLSTSKNTNISTEIDESMIGGWGVHILKSLSDEISYEIKNGQNHLCIKKYLL